MTEKNLDNPGEKPKEPAGQESMSDELREMAEKLESNSEDAIKASDDLESEELDDGLPIEDISNDSDSSESKEPAKSEQVEEFDYEKEKQKIEDEYKIRYNAVQELKKEFLHEIGHTAKDNLGLLELTRNPSGDFSPSQMEFIKDMFTRQNEMFHEKESQLKGLDDRRAAEREKAIDKFKARLKNI